MKLKAAGKLAVTFLLVCAFAGGSSAYCGTTGSWHWSKKEKKQVAKITKKVEEKEVEAENEYQPSGKFFVYESEHWLVMTEISPEFTAEVTCFMEMFYDIFFKVSKIKEKTVVKRKPTVVVFNNEAEYLKVCRLQGSRGVFTYAARGDEFGLFHIYTYVDGRLGKNFSMFYRPVIQHEATHCLLQSQFGTTHMPQWFNEGMATYYEYWDMRRDEKYNRTRRNAKSYRPELLGDYIVANRGKCPPLDYLLGLNTAEKWDVDNMGKQTSLHYVLAESFMDCMLSSKKKAKTVQKIINRILEGEEELLTGSEKKKLEPAWHKHIQKIRR